MRCVTCAITRGVSYVRVSQGRLAMPLQDMNLKARHVLFLASLRGVPQLEEVRRKANAHADDATNCDVAY